MEAQNRLDQFRGVRGAFESLVLAHPVIVKPAAHKLGSGARTRSKMVALFDRTLKLLAADPDADKAWTVLKSEYSHLALDEAEEATADVGGPGRGFSTGAKSAVTLADLAFAPRCRLCGGLLHRNGKVLDHIEKKADGGSSFSKNGRWVHPICNSNRDKDGAMVRTQANA